MLFARHGWTAEDIRALRELGPGWEAAFAAFAERYAEELKEVEQRE